MTEEKRLTDTQKRAIAKTTAAVLLDLKGRSIDEIDIHEVARQMNEVRDEEITLALGLVPGQNKG